MLPAVPEAFDDLASGAQGRAPGPPPLEIMNGPALRPLQPLQPSGDIPHVSGGIQNAAHAVTPELVGSREENLGTNMLRPLDHCVYLLAIQVSAEMECPIQVPLPFGHRGAINDPVGAGRVRRTGGFPTRENPSPWRTPVANLERLEPEAPRNPAFQPTRRREPDRALDR